SFVAVGIFLATLLRTGAQITFTKITTGEVVNDVGHFTGVTWGDFDNDGFLDLSASIYGGTNVLYRNIGDVTFGKVVQGDPDADIALHTGSTVGDYDNDGFLDLIVSAGEGFPPAAQNMLYHNNGNGTFSRASGGNVTNKLGYFRVNAWADYDNDGF